MLRYVNRLLMSYKTGKINNTLILPELIDQTFFCTDIGIIPISVQKKVWSLQKKVGSLQKKVWSLQKKVWSLQKKVGSLQKRVGSLQKKVGSLQKKVGSLQKKVWSLQKKVGIVHTHFADIIRPLDIMF